MFNPAGCVCGGGVVYLTFDGKKQDKTRQRIIYLCDDLPGHWGAAVIEQSLVRAGIVHQMAEQCSSPCWLSWQGVGEAEEGSDKYSYFL